MVNYETIDTREIMLWLYRRSTFVLPVGKWQRLVHFLKGYKYGN